jgi:hypothetical protein
MMTHRRKGTRSPSPTSNGGLVIGDVSGGGGGGGGSTHTTNDRGEGTYGSSSTHSGVGVRTRPSRHIAADAPSTHSTSKSNALNGNDHQQISKSTLLPSTYQSPPAISPTQNNFLLGGSYYPSRDHRGNRKLSDSRRGTKGRRIKKSSLMYRIFCSSVWRMIVSLLVVSYSLFHLLIGPVLYEIAHEYFRYYHHVRTHGGDTTGAPPKPEKIGQRVQDSWKKSRLHDTKLPHSFEEAKSVAGKLHQHLKLKIKEGLVDSNKRTEILEKISPEWFHRNDPQLLHIDVQEHVKHQQQQKHVDTFESQDHDGKIASTSAIIKGDEQSHQQENHQLLEDEDHRRHAEQEEQPRRDEVVQQRRAEEEEQRHREEEDQRRRAEEDRRRREEEDSRRREEEEEAHRRRVEKERREDEDHRRREEEVQRRREEEVQQRREEEDQQRRAEEGKQQRREEEDQQRLAGEEDQRRREEEDHLRWEEEDRRRRTEDDHRRRAEERLLDRNEDSRQELANEPRRRLDENDETSTVSSMENTHPFQSISNRDIFGGHIQCPVGLPADDIQVTLVLQSSIDRLWILDETCRRWSGPVIAVVAIPNRTFHEDAAVLQREWKEKCHQLDLIPFNLVNDHESPEKYPINRLRNIGLRAVKTSHILLLDIDFVPSLGLNQRIRDTIIERSELRLQLPELHSSKVPSEHRDAIVVPAFEKRFPPECISDPDCQPLRVNSSFIPRTFDELRDSVLGSKDVIVFQSDVNWEGHHSTNSMQWLAKEWFDERVPAFTSSNSNATIRNIRSIDCFDSLRYEPYVVLRWCPSGIYEGKPLPVAPFYDERFVGYGKNKIQYVSHLRFTGYQFGVLPEEFIVHNPHSESNTKKRWNNLTESSLHREMDALYPRFLKELMQKYQGPHHVIGECSNT